MRDHLTCRELVELVTDYLERALPPETASLFEEHLNFCDGCQAYLAQMRATIAAAGRVEVDDVPPEARVRLLEAFRHWRGG